jgi:hypothetical protein
MTADPRQELYRKTVAALKPALERVVADPAFRERLEKTPLAVLDELGVELDAATRADLQGKRFSEFWAARRRSVEGPVESRDLPPAKDAIDDRKLEAVSGGNQFISITHFAPPYVPVGP